MSCRTICVQCALRAFCEDIPAPIFDETPEEHRAKYHPDPESTRIEREMLERRASVKLRDLKLR